MPTVSIVLPTYNGSRYIRESIESILGQSYSDWELIIVDDCSVDGTLEIIHGYEHRDARIHVIHNETNKKLPASLNIGFGNAKGEYLTWTSDDNMYLQDALAVMVNELSQSDVPMVCADMYIIDEEGRVKEGIVQKYRDEEICRYNQVGACFLYRREILDSVGIYDTNLYCVEDYDYWLRIKKRYGRIQRIEKVLYKYRRHDASLSVAQRGKVRAALVLLHRKYLDFIIEELSKNKDILCSFYYDLVEDHILEENMKREILKIIPELKNDRLGIKGRYIIFGAGAYGARAFQILFDTVEYFADNNLDKVGTAIEGKEIITFHKMISMHDQYDIIVARNKDNIYPLIRQLSEAGIQQYCTLQTYLAEK